MTEEKKEESTIMELGIPERLLFINTLPRLKVNAITLGVVDSLLKEVSFSEKEISDFEIEADGGNISWNVTKATPKKVVFGPVAKQVVIKVHDELDRNEALELWMKHTLFNKFMEEKT
jgi:hypothetical protein